MASRLAARRVLTAGWLTLAPTVLWVCRASWPSARAATLPVGFAEATAAGGLSAATAMAFAPDGRLFVAEQGGRLRVIS